MIKSDLSRRAVPLGAGASARGTGMLARSGPSAAAGSGGLPPLASASEPQQQHGQAAPPPASQQASASVPHTNPLKRLTANTLRHLHGAAGQNNNNSSSRPQSAASAGAANRADNSHHHHHPQHPAPSAGAVMRQRALGDVVIGDDPSSAVAVPSAAARLYVDMNADEIGEEARLASRGWRLQRGGGGGGGAVGGGRGCCGAFGNLFQTIHPLDPRYRSWWTTTIGAALATGWIEPFRIAFLETRSQGLTTAPHLWINALSVAVLALFCCDIFVSFFVGYYDGDGILVMRRGAVAWHYITCVRE
jgi:hypothetical protein